MKHESSVYLLSCVFLFQNYNKTMSEYWKSVPRKFCDFCKCWITDNKPSVEFHERGKRHQENVELKLKEVRKKSLQKSADDEQLKKDMEKMEKAALEAFKKDLKDNPELAAKYGVSLEPKPQPSTVQDHSPLEKVTTSKTNNTKSDKEAKVKEWREAVTPEGHHYYWSSVTGESVWEAPKDYLSLAEQEVLKNKTASKTISVHESKEVKDKTKGTTVEKNQTAASGQKTKINSITEAGNSRSAYGSWSVVKEIEQPTLYEVGSAPPELNEIPLPTEPTSGDSAPVYKKNNFKEKTVTSLCPESGETVVFKKRKIASGVQGINSSQVVTKIKKVDEFIILTDIISTMLM
ncbi:WW domain binding protein 4 [Bulinus truncatus]|nr:WW domain binding protein 4 [Bulinus truncatus]